jgi:hypothetical protein
MYAYSWSCPVADTVSSSQMWRGLLRSARPEPLGETITFWEKVTFRRNVVTSVHRCDVPRGDRMGTLDLLGLVLQCASGAAGGNLTGNVFRSLNLGWLGNSLAGMIGGGIGSQLVNNSLGLAATTAVAGPDPGTVIAQLSGGGIGGVVMAMLVGTLAKLGR